MPEGSNEKELSPRSMKSEQREEQNKLKQGFQRGQVVKNTRREGGNRVSIQSFEGIHLKKGKTR